MRDKEYSHALLPHLVNLAQAALPEVNVADGKSLIHQQHVWIDMYGDRKSQSDRHTARISLYRMIHELADFSEVGNALELAIDLPLAQPQNCRVQINIVASRELRIESRAQFEQRRHPPAHLYLAGTRMQNTGY